MDGQTRAGVALVPGPSGHGPSARRRRRPGLLLPGLWLLLLARPASCAPGKHRGDPACLDCCCFQNPAFPARTLLFPTAPSPSWLEMLFHSSRAQPPKARREERERAGGWWPILLMSCKALLLTSESEAGLVASSPNVPLFSLQNPGSGIVCVRGRGKVVYEMLGGTLLSG